MTENCKPLPPAVAAHLAEIEHDIAGLEAQADSLRTLIDRRRYEHAAILRTVELMQEANPMQQAIDAGNSALPTAARFPRQRHDLREVVRDMLQQGPMLFPNIVISASVVLGRKVRIPEITNALSRMGNEVAQEIPGEWRLSIAGGGERPPAPAEGSGK